MLDALENATSVMLTAHVSPDGDALGAMLALREGLIQRYARITRVDCIISGGVPRVYAFMPGFDTIRTLESDPDILPHYDVALSMDCGSLERLGAVGPRFLASGCAINLDHHLNNTLFGHVNIVIPDASASGEVVADLMDAMGISTYTPAMAVGVYAALITDTGGFRFANTTAKTMRLAARCLEAGIDHETIYKQLYEKKPRPQVALQADAIASAAFEQHDRLCWTSVTQAMFARHGATEEHTDGIVDALRQVDSVQAAVVFKEMADGSVRVSLRSDRHDLNVADIAARFGGGGHKMAAGCTLQGALPAAQAAVLPLLRAQLATLLSG